MRPYQLVPALCLAVILASCQQSDPDSGLASQAEPQASSVTTENDVSDDSGPANSKESVSGNEALVVFEKRILPIFQAKKPSSCTECHLSGVELKDYIQSDQAKTFASLVSVGLIDVQKPDDSKILQFINRSPEKPNLITDKVRQQEHDAFQAWIRAAVTDPDLLASKSSEAIGPQIPDEVIRHARKDRVLASFIDNVWTEVGRCAACHSPDQNQKQVKEHGEQVSWITLRDPQATLNHMIDAGIINADEPLESMLLTKQPEIARAISVSH